MLNVIVKLICFLEHFPTPYNEYTYHMIKALEEKNDGLFDYDQENQRNMCSK